MNKTEKRNLYWKLYINPTASVSEYYNTLIETNDMQYNYREHMTTHPINCDKELERLTHADYKTCCCLLTMLIREDHFCEGAFERRVASGQIRMVLEKILFFLVQDITINEFIDLLYHYNVYS